MKPAPFGYAAPHEVAEILELLDHHGADAKVLAGGQSLLPMVNMRLARPALLVDVNRAPELHGIEAQSGGVRIGATTRQLEAERELPDRLPLLCAALRHVGHVATRARGTIGGSLAHADPAGELPAVLRALDGTVIARSLRRGERRIAAADFQTATMTTALEDDELVTAVELPARPAARHGFVELARRHGDFAIVGAAVEVEVDDDGRYTRVSLALFGVADRPLRLPAVEEALVGVSADDHAALDDIADAVRAAVDPGSDLHASAGYRRHAAGVVARRALSAAALEPARSIA